MKQMTFPFLFFILVSSLICVTCRQAMSNKKNVPPITDLPLAKKEIYNFYRVKRAREIAHEFHKTIAKEKFEQGKTAINQGNIEAGIDSFIISLQHYPTAETYFYMGNTQLELKQHEDAISAYKMAKFIGYKSPKYLFYNMACAYAMDDSDLDGKRRSINYLRRATQNGYDNKDSLLTDKRLQNIRYTYEFNKIFLQTFQKNDKDTSTKFYLFASLFPRIKFPIKIEPDDLGKTFSKKRRLHEPLGSLTGREEYIPDEEHYFAVASLKKTKNFVAVLYLAYPVYSSERPYRQYEIATYTWAGENIDKILFADTSNPDKYLSGEIDKDLNIILSTHQNIWEYNPDEYGYSNNRVEYSNFMYEEKFRIDEKGKIVIY